MFGPERVGVIRLGNLHVYFTWHGAYSIPCAFSQLAQISTSPLARLDYPLKHPASSPEYLYIMRPPVDDDSQDEQAEEENKIINEVNTLSFVLNGPQRRMLIVFFCRSTKSGMSMQYHM